MTIKECIDIVDNLKPNQYSIEDKVNWLSFLDMTIINEVLRTHEGYDGRYDNFTGYSADRLEMVLIVPSPYDRVYTAYLKMKIDEENGETARYNNSVTLYNSYLTEFKKWYNSNHMPLSPSEIRKRQESKPQLDVSEAQLEQLRKLLYAQLNDDVLKAVSNDKLYAIVKSYVDNNIQMFRGKTEPSDVVTSKNARIGYITLYANKWSGVESKYKQVVSVDGVTPNSQVDLTPSAEQLAIFYNKDLSFVTENDNGVVTVYAIGQKPENNYTIQVTITEVEV